MRAIILAGGKGTRLQPYTTLIPKPLVPIGDKYSILEIVIMQLVNNGFTHITLAVNHFCKLIMAYFGDGQTLGAHIDYSLEEHELGTIGPLSIIQDLPENFLVMNGDILSDFNYKLFYDEHVKNKRQISVATYKRQQKIDFGVVKYNDENILTGFEEKPSLNLDVSMGIYCINKSVIANITKNKPYGFDNLMINSLLNNQTVNIYPFSGYWLDIGRPDDYKMANENYQHLLDKFGI